MKKVLLVALILLGGVSYSQAQQLRGPVTENSIQRVGSVEGPAVMAIAGPAVMKKNVPFYIPGAVAPVRPGPGVPQYFPPGVIPRTPFFW